MNFDYNYYFSQLVHASLDQRNEVATIRRAISDISHHIDRDWNIDDHHNIDQYESCELVEDNSIYKIQADADLDKVKCDCCGLEEDCTQTYITRIRETYSGKWVCGLCSEVMKETTERDPARRTVDQAMRSHRAICEEFNSTRLNPKLSLTNAMKNLAKRVSENRIKSVPGLLHFKRLGRASSCVPRIEQL